MARQATTQISLSRWFAEIAVRRPLMAPRSIPVLLLALALTAGPALAEVLAKGKPSAGFYWQKMLGVSNQVVYSCRSVTESKRQRDLIDEADTGLKQLSRERDFNQRELEKKLEIARKQSNGEDTVLLEKDLNWSKQFWWIDEETTRKVEKAEKIRRDQRCYDARAQKPW